MTDPNPGPDRSLSADKSFAHWLEGKRTPALIVAILSALFWTVLYLQFTIDDAFISFRYGKNLVDRHVWNWNASGPREEAYTSAVYTVASIVPALLHLSPSLFFIVFQQALKNLFTIIRQSCSVA